MRPLRLTFANFAQKKRSADHPNANIIILMQNKFLSIAAVSGILCVGLGAFGAHSLKEHLDESSLKTFETGVRYQFYHTFALLFVWLTTRNQKEKQKEKQREKEKEGRNEKIINLSGYLFLIGIILFSGSLYIMSCSNLIGIGDQKWIGAITPLGGLSFISGWVCLLIYSLRSSQ